MKTAKGREVYLEYVKLLEIGKSVFQALLELGEEKAISLLRSEWFPYDIDWRTVIGLGQVESRWFKKWAENEGRESVDGHVLQQWVWDLLKREASESSLGDAMQHSWSIYELAIHFSEPIENVKKAVANLLVEDEIFRDGDGGYLFCTLRCTAGGTDETSSAWNSVSQSTGKLVEGLAEQVLIEGRGFFSSLCKLGGDKVKKMLRSEKFPFKMRTAHIRSLVKKERGVNEGSSNPPMPKPPPARLPVPVRGDEKKGKQRMEPRTPSERK